MTVQTVNEFKMSEDTG